MLKNIAEGLSASQIIMTVKQQHSISEEQILDILDSVIETTNKYQFVVGNLLLIAFREGEKIYSGAELKNYKKHIMDEFSRRLGKSTKTLYKYVQAVLAYPPEVTELYPFDFSVFLECLAVPQMYRKKFMDELADERNRGIMITVTRIREKIAALFGDEKVKDEIPKVSLNGRLYVTEDDILLETKNGQEISLADLLRLVHEVPVSINIKPHPENEEEEQQVLQLLSRFDELMY